MREKCSTGALQRALVFGLFAGLLAAGSMVTADDQNGSLSDLDELMERLGDLETLRGDFRQSTLDGSERRIQSQRGEFQLSRPDRLYWYTEPPYEQALYVADDIIWNYDADLEQATRQPVTDQWEQSPALILTGSREEIDERYQVEQTSRRDDYITFTLKPRAGGGSVESLSISFDGQIPVSLRLLDSFNQTTVVNFEALERNIELDDQKFVFDPPDHVDVIEQMGQ